MQVDDIQPAVLDLLACSKVDCRTNFLGYCDRFGGSEFVDVEFADGENCTDYKPDDRKCGECGDEKDAVPVHYGADADGLRGIYATLPICPNCG
ncbi:hypothetical protein CIG75_19230 [Tumebacillus algifaecis]|uniref:Uncharacterized protein n=1 Tax=Tumebacillus algifaecis TaxID=1214604 RepID=A0A223D5V2_9BACL|nr:hypothetical protein [Tumebacillus algifaecis]ASS76867.1 hypothetical protein CIG75_19230 [Tumebacillus algifaecis]